MAKKGIVTTLAGLAVAGAAVGGAIAYLKKCKSVNNFAEEDFDDLDYLDEENSSCGCAPERTYTTLPNDNTSKEDTAAPSESSEEEDGQAASEPVEAETQEETENTDPNAAEDAEGEKEEM